MSSRMSDEYRAQEERENNAGWIMSHEKRIKKLEEQLNKLCEIIEEKEAE